MLWCLHSVRDVHHLRFLAFIVTCFAADAPEAAAADAPEAAAADAPEAAQRA